jgi:hypothetical protein
MDTPCDLEDRAARVENRFRDLTDDELREVIDYSDTLAEQFQAIDALLLRETYYGRRRAA